MADGAARSSVDAAGAPRFKRVLSRGDLILYGLVILTPTALSGLRHCAAGVARPCRAELSRRHGGDNVHSRELRQDGGGVSVRWFHLHLRAARSQRARWFCGRLGDDAGLLFDPAAQRDLCRAHRRAPVAAGAIPGVGRAVHGSHHVNQHPRHSGYPRAPAP